MVGGHVPDALAKLMRMTEEPMENPQEQGGKLDDEPRVRRRVLQLASGKRGEILASSVYDAAPVLLTLLGVPRSGDLDGEVPEDLLTGDLVAAVARVEAYPIPPVGLIESVDSRAPEDELMIERLRSLGYVDAER